MLAIPIFLPLISGFVLFLLATAGHKWQEGITKKLSVAVMGIVLLTAVFHGINLYGKSPAVTVWKLKEDIPILLNLDDLGTVFSTLVVFVWILITLYTFSYMKGDKKGARFLGCHLMTLGMLMGITSAGNLVTMYLFYEGMTLHIRNIHLFPTLLASFHRQTFLTVLCKSFSLPVLVLFFSGKDNTFW